MKMSLRVFGRGMGGAFRWVVRRILEVEGGWWLDSSFW